MQVHMLALDLDGTLLRNDKTLTQYTLDVLRRCRDKGIRVVIATARSERVAQRIVDLLHPDAVISSGGARVTVGGQVICEKKLSILETQAVIDAVCRQGMLNLTVETEEGTFVTWEKPKHPDHAHAEHWDFAQPLGCAAYKITPEFAGEAAARAVAAQFPQCGMHAFSGERWYRFARHDANKLEGVRAVCRHWGLQLADVAAFGDDWTDMDMVLHCGVGVAMENAIAEVKAAANHVCLSNEEDGVARWAEQNLLQKTAL